MRLSPYLKKNILISQGVLLLHYGHGFGARGDAPRPPLYDSHTNCIFRPWVGQVGTEQRRL
jgi:hypothetical protein